MTQRMIDLLARIAQGGVMVGVADGRTAGALERRGLVEAKTVYFGSLLGYLPKWAVTTKGRKALEDVAGHG